MGCNELVHADRNENWASEDTTDTVVKTTITEDPSTNSGCTVWVENTLRDMEGSNREVVVNGGDYQYA
jgi:hypothetical protein